MQKDKDINQDKEKHRAAANRQRHQDEDIKTKSDIETKTSRQRHEDKDVYHACYVQYEVSYVTHTHQVSPVEYKKRLFTLQVSRVTHIHSAMSHRKKAIFITSKSCHTHQRSHVT